MEHTQPLKPPPHGDKIAKPVSKRMGFDSAQWEVVGDVTIRPAFQRQTLETIKLEEAKMDPLFRSFDASVRRVNPLASEIKKEGVKPQEDTISAKEIARLISEAEARGRSIALEEAKLIRESELGAIESKVFEILQSIKESTEVQIQTIERAAIEVSIRLSKKIIEQAVEINPEYIIDVIREAMAHAGSAAIKKIKVSSQDLEFIEVMGVSKKIKEFDGSWVFESDESIKSGCVIETSAGEVDFNLDRSWERIAESVVRLIK